MKDQKHLTTQNVRAVQQINQFHIVSFSLRLIDKLVIGSHYEQMKLLIILKAITFYLYVN